MDFTLRCNSLKCRSQLTDRAVVTTCSHIFCVACSDGINASATNQGVRICPACETQLANPDDAVLTQLNPTEDYKTSVLSGLSPSIIMECAGRGLAFYSYQATQEIIYQEYLAKSLTGKYTNLSTQMDKLVQDANTEITSLRDKLAALEVDHKNLQQRNHEIAEAFREKSKSQAQVQKMYQTLKTQVMASNVGVAASDDAEQIIQSATGISRGAQHQSRRPSVDSNGDRARGPWNNNRASNVFTSQPQSQSRLFAGQTGSIAQTPSGHRTRLYGNPLQSNRSHSYNIGEPMVGVSNTPNLSRQPLNSLNANFTPSGLAGYGMSAGLRSGNKDHSSLARHGGWSARSGPGSNLGLR